MIEKAGSIRLYLLASAAKDSVLTQLGWQNTSKITNAGEIQTTTKFTDEEGKTAAQMRILPTQVIISDSIWDVRTATIDFNADSTIQVHDFRFENKKQFVHIDGKASRNRNDSITVSMNDLNLDYVMQIVKLKGISIGGYVSGKATLFSLLKQPIFIADLDVKKVALNQKLIGDAKVTSTWDNENKQILLEGKFFNDQKDTLALPRVCIFLKVIR